MLSFLEEAHRLSLEHLGEAAEFLLLLLLRLLIIPNESELVEMANESRVVCIG